MNGTVTRNQLIFDYAAGKLGPSKSIFTSAYLYLNSKASKLNQTFESMLGDDLINNQDVPTSNLKFTDCLKSNDYKDYMEKAYKNVDPITKVVGPLSDIKWKQIYKGFSEFNPKINDEDELKLIKMEPGTSVPIHSHGVKNIYCSRWQFCDEYGKYSKGDIQINDQKIKHTPIACQDEGCVCLSITEKDAIFFGRFGSFLNLFTFIKSFFK